MAKALDPNWKQPKYPSVSRWPNKHIVLYSYPGVQRCNNKKWTTDTLNMNKSQNYYIEGKKPEQKKKKRIDTVGLHLHTILKNANSCTVTTDHVVAWGREWESNMMWPTVADLLTGRPTSGANTQAQTHSQRRSLPRPAALPLVGEWSWGRAGLAEARCPVSQTTQTSLPLRRMWDCFVIKIQM